MPARSASITRSPASACISKAPCLRTSRLYWPNGAPIPTQRSTRAKAEKLEGSTDREEVVEHCREERDAVDEGVQAPVRALCIEAGIVGPLLCEHMPHPVHGPGHDDEDRSIEREVREPPPAHERLI